LGNKNREKALNRLGRLLESGEKFTGILGAIARHFNYLVMIDSLRELRSDNMVSAKIGVAPYFVSKCREQIVGFDDDGLKNALRDIFEAEYQNRFEDMSDAYILENLVIKITAAQE
jgi:DNA polymerase III delta subunit